MTDYTQQLAGFLAGLCYQDLPPVVLTRMEELFLDWLDLVLAGKGQHPIPLFEHYTERMGPTDGSAQTLSSWWRSSSYFAALVNGMASRVMEQDDLYNGSVLRPAAVVFPTVLTAAQDLGRSDAEPVLAAAAGYEAGIRIGEFLGRSHYRVFHTTVTVGILIVAVAVGKPMDLNRERFVDLLGSAGTRAAGLWEFLRDATDSKQLHTTKAAADGLLAAYLTANGLSGARHILEGEQGMAVGVSNDADPERLVDCFGSRWASLETSLKFHVSCRRTYPAADALLALMQREGPDHPQVVVVTARVRQDAVDVFGRVVEPQTVHQVKFSMDTVLDLIVVYGKTGLGEFHRYVLSDPWVTAFRERVEIRLDPEVDAAYPWCWFGRVEVLDGEGRRHTTTTDEPKGGPGNTLSRDELADKFHRLLVFSGAVTGAEAEILIQRARGLRQTPSVTPLI